MRGSPVSHPATRCRASGRVSERKPPSFRSSATAKNGRERETRIKTVSLALSESLSIVKRWIINFRQTSVVFFLKLSNKESLLKPSALRWFLGVFFKKCPLHCRHLYENNDNCLRGTSAKFHLATPASECSSVIQQAASFFNQFWSIFVK